MAAMAGKLSGKILSATVFKSADRETRITVRPDGTGQINDLDNSDKGWKITKTVEFTRAKDILLGCFKNADWKLSCPSCTSEPCKCKDDGLVTHNLLDRGL
jgi:hypothetical protein